MISSISVNKSDWLYAAHNETKECVFEKMIKNRFDVLPIREADGSYKKYFRTKERSNFYVDDIKAYEIKPEDCMDHLAGIKVAIKAFAESDRDFFFVTSKKKVTGLLTMGNLNSKHVYVYLYNLIAQLEFGLGKLINRSGIDDNELYRIFEESGKSVKPNTRYRREIKKGLDHKFVEFAYIGDMAWIIREKNLHRKIGIAAKEFDLSIKLINKLRNVVSHPVNSLIKGKNSVIELDMTIEKMESLILKIDEFIMQLS